MATLEQVCMLQPTGRNGIVAGSTTAGPSTASSTASTAEALQRSKRLQKSLPPMEGSVKYKPSWTIEETLEQHQSLMRQHELQSGIGYDHLQVQRLRVEFARLEAIETAARARELLASNSPEAAKGAAEEANTATKKLLEALRMQDIEERRAVIKTEAMEREIAKNNAQMVKMRESIDDVSRSSGPLEDENGVPLPTESIDTSRRNYFYCSDCKVGGHGQRFCSYLLKRPQWRIYPTEKWFTDTGGTTSYCPLGRRGVDFTDETYFSRIAMHLKGRIWLEDKRKLYEFVPELMPPTYVIADQKWVGSPPPPDPPGAEPMPWFVKETDRNWGTSVTCCARPEECIGLTKPDATYVVQRHIPNPLLYDNGEKCHIKFYNLMIGEADGVTFKVYCYKDGYLSISPKAWSPTDLSKETQVTIIRTKRINDWPAWPLVYPRCKQGVQTVVERAVKQRKLEGRDKKQFEIISADFIVSNNHDVYLLEFNTGPVLKDPEDSPDVHDADLIQGALHLVMPWEGGSEGKWDFVCEVKSPSKGY
eukprot:gnl/TRDRNA2_/TRDRNA2_188294_c0_seq1.p1 gnl/TRDRNA2_/TRDRNA2_188294_c0~~gnl/TRDRNA2_/TRDRNA2_188294_c0_seq1.p1  ORF type:complete len:534 (+),score=100.80 gnl/TRDRNA2_/TRDRNA2_188294_c0_seq1:81-1682(+)